MKIGFFDSGIGGLTVLHQALKYLPNEDYIFYADTENVPYGEKSKEEVRQYIFQGVSFLANLGVKAIVIACNTATSIAIDDLREMYDFPVIGIEPAVKPAVKKCRKSGQRVLVMATELTLKEEKYHDLVESLDYDDIIDSLPMPGLVKLAESNQFEKEMVLPYLKEALTPFSMDQYGTVVLGCTHFPYFLDVIQEAFGEDTAVISGNEGTARQLKRTLEERQLLGNGTGQITYYQSGKLMEDEETLKNYQSLLDRL